MSSGGCGTHIAIRSYYELYACMRRALVQVVVVSGDRDVERVSGGYRRARVRASTLGHQHELRGLNHGLLLFRLLPSHHRDSVPPPQLLTGSVFTAVILCEEMRPLMTLPRQGHQGDLVCGRQRQEGSHPSRPPRPVCRLAVVPVSGFVEFGSRQS